MPQSLLSEDSNQFDYLKVLKVINSLPFDVGKKLLIDFLLGNKENESVTKNKLHKKALFGSFELYTKEEVEDIIENLIHNDLVEYRSLHENKFVKVLALTE